MTYGITSEKGKVLFITSKLDERTGQNIEIKQKLTVKQARSFARAIYSYCRGIEKEEHD